MHACATSPVRRGQQDPGVDETGAALQPCFVRHNIGAVVLVLLDEGAHQRGHPFVAIGRRLAAAKEGRLHQRLVLPGKQLPPEGTTGTFTK